MLMSSYSSFLNLNPNIGVLWIFTLFFCSFITDLRTVKSIFSSINSWLAKHISSNSIFLLSPCHLITKMSFDSQTQEFNYFFLYFTNIISLAKYNIIDQPVYHHLLYAVDHWECVLYYVSLANSPNFLIKNLPRFISQNFK